MKLVALLSVALFALASANPAFSPLVAAKNWVVEKGSLPARRFLSQLTGRRLACDATTVYATIAASTEGQAAMTCATANLATATYTNCCDEVGTLLHKYGAEFAVCKDDPTFAIFVPFTTACAGPVTTDPDQDGKDDHDGHDHGQDDKDDHGDDDDDQGGGMDPDSMGNSANMFEAFAPFTDPEGNAGSLKNPDDEFDFEGFEKAIEDFAAANPDATVCNVGGSIEVTGSLIELMTETAKSEKEKAEIPTGPQEIIPTLSVPCNSDADSSHYILPVLLAGFGVDADKLVCRGSECKCGAAMVRMDMKMKIDFDKMVKTMMPPGMELPAGMDINTLVEQQIDATPGASAEEKAEQKKLFKMINSGFDMNSEIKLNLCVSAGLADGVIDLDLEVPDMNAAETDEQESIGMDIKLAANGKLSVGSGTAVKDKIAPDANDKVYIYDGAKGAKGEKKEGTVVSVDSDAGTAVVTVDGAEKTVKLVAVTSALENDSLSTPEVSEPILPGDGGSGAAKAISGTVAALLVCISALLLL